MLRTDLCQPQLELHPSTLDVRPFVHRRTGTGIIGWQEGIGLCCGMSESGVVLIDKGWLDVEGERMNDCGADEWHGDGRNISKSSSLLLPYIFA